MGNRALVRDFQPGSLAQIVGPAVHELAAALEEIGALVGAFYAIAVDVGERDLRNFFGRVGLLGYPLPEAGPEAMRYACNAEP